MKDTSTSQAREIIRHPTLYFSDGDVVISVESAHVQHLFRVDKVFLSRHSKTFAQLFALPETPTGENCDGVPLIPLYGDDPEGIAGLLTFLYNPASLQFRRRDPTTPIIAYQILQVATKYQVDSVKPLIDHQLVTDWPTTLNEWLVLEDELEKAARDELGLQSLSRDDRFPEPASAIRIALDYNIPSILPAAFYTLSRIRAKEDWLRRRNRDWRYRNVDVDNDSVSNRSGLRTARWELLERDALYCLLLGKGLLADCELDFDQLFLIKHPPASCTSECAAQRELLVRETWKIGSEPLECPDPLGRLRRWLKKVHSQCGLCPLCMLWLGRRIERTVGRIWDDLPAMFRIDVLLRDRALV